MFSGKKLYWLFQILGWSTLFFLHLFFIWSYGKFDTAHDRKLFLERTTIFVILGIAITHLMRILILRMKLLDKKLKIQIISFFLLSAVVSIFCGIFEIEIFRYFKILTEKENEMLSKTGFRLFALSNSFSWFLYIFIWNSIYLLYHFITNYQKQQIDTLQLKSVVKELELNTIKSHINPHFIFNALNSIRAMVDEDPRRARNAITELSNILRSSINMHKTETVLLEEELSIVSDYLALEHMRFEDRLIVKFDIDEKTRTIPVPPMMLQTLVENAIKHGISNEVKGGIIQISSLIENNYLKLTVENTGKLDSGNTEGFGMKSTKERLNILYGEKGSFEINQVTPSTVVATVFIPLGVS